MSAIRYSPPAKVKGVCWTEEEALGLNIVVKEEKEEEDVTVKNEVTLDGEVVTVKEEEVTVKEEEDAFRVKEENAVFSVKKDGEITVILKEEEEEKTGDLINTISYDRKELLDIRTAITHLVLDKDFFFNESDAKDVPKSPSFA
ncbi:hypothetical protein J4Q44_G00006860 [Coregonus suidteri]|uniref:Uncharacterized protein n=1 Tax=Coregonus suidteri TaxID=861788 RepID=A0AAN8MET7_9TELE